MGSKTQMLSCSCGRKSVVTVAKGATEADWREALANAGWDAVEEPLPEGATRDTFYPEFRCLGEHLGVVPEESALYALLEGG